MRLFFVIAAALASFTGTAGAAAEFEAYPAQIYVGKAVTPSFKGGQRAYASYRTRIRQSTAAGPRFGGRYALAVIGCGAGCRFGVITDLKTGIIRDLPLGGETYPVLIFRARPDSRLLQTQWEPAGAGGEAPGCALQDFVWTGEAFTPTGKPRFTREVCPAWDDAS